MEVRDTFYALLDCYTCSTEVKNELWNELVLHYTAPARFYHTLKHLECLLTELTEVKETLQSWEATLFTLFYHDAIYEATQPNNEEQSALLAAKRMEQVLVPKPIIASCCAQIEATKHHLGGSNTDTCYFLDADLCILGQDAETYAAYRRDVRKEYAIFPDATYNQGRKAVLQHFLNMDRIYKTPHFYHKYEDKARQNLHAELTLY